MFNKFKETVQVLAKQAVYLAEKTLTGEEGRKKKQMALEYVISNIPVCAPFKRIVAKIIAGFIDDTIELAFQCMNSLSSELEN